MPKKRLFVITVAIVILCGCSVLNPYRSKFKCPPGDPGKCQSTRDAYYESLQGDSTAGSGLVPAKAAECKDCSRKHKKEKSHNDDLEISLPTLKPASYSEMVLDRFSSSLGQPEAPMVLPAQAIRILVLPYKGVGGNLYTERYIYTFVEEPKWLLEFPE